MKTYYICHYCFKHFTINKYDIKKHFDRKKKCICSTIIPYEECKKLSLTKKFIFTFEIETLTHDDLLFITTHYTDTENFINSNFRQINLQNFIQSAQNSIYQYKNNLKQTNSLLHIENQFENQIEKKEFDKLYYHPDKDKYICNICFAEYISKQNMLKHLQNEKQCASNQERNEIIKKNQEKALILLQKEAQNQQIYNTYIQNNQNNNNQNHNTHHNTYNFSMRDFVHENYDLTHIKDSFYAKKDFFIYSNFLQAIMENKKNQNIFFADNEAIIYSDKELNKMSSDKAGYLVLDKLSQSFTQLMNKQPDETRDFYSFVTKYYNVLKGQYKHDTIFKDYDVDERRFVYTSNSALFRSRDKYLSKISTTVNKYGNGARENMNLHIQDIKAIPTINPNIEDYASVKMRYRDLRS